MEKKGKISEYREKLDETLASHELINSETLKALVKSQLDSSEECDADFLDKKTIEVSNFLETLRSASVKEHEVSRSIEASHGDWKDNEDFRVMYREGPQGTPYHTLLVEGYVDGPVDVCLCISWESTLYKKWWPQSAFPTFKITNCECLEKVRIGEQISSIRMKVPWPMSDRAALVRYSSFDYFQDGLIVVLLKSISDSAEAANICKTTHGNAKNGITQTHDAVMMDLVGGFALQKVAPGRSYFRTIATIDIKLDLIPPSLMNFISRQLVGNGFKLYRKTVASVSKSSNDYSEALGDQLYSRIRDALYSVGQLNEALEVKEAKRSEDVIPKQELIKSKLKNDMQQESQADSASVNDESKETLEVKETKSDATQQKSQTDEASLNSEPATKKKHFGEIEEEGLKNSIPSSEVLGSVKIAGNFHKNGESNVCISPEVKQALDTLEKVISFIRNYGFNAGTPSSSSVSNEEVPPISIEDTLRDSTFPETMVVSDSKVCTSESKKEMMDDSRSSSGIHSVRRVGSTSFSRDRNHNNRIAPASPEQDLPMSSVTSVNGTADLSTIDTIYDDDGRMRNEAGGAKDPQQKRHRFCCLGWY